MKYRFYYIIGLLMLITSNVSSQNIDQDNFVQFSGVVLTEEDDRPLPLPLVSIAIVGTSRGTYTDFDGFFSLVAKKGDTITFSSIGFKDVEFVIPASLKQDRYTLYQLMSQDTFLLPMTVVYPWPSKEHFKLEFLALDIKDEVQAQVNKNLNESTMDNLLVVLEADGRENASRYFRDQTKKNYYAGQVAPMNILNPLAWMKFFKAWKRGDFKKKKLIKVTK